MDKVCIYLRKSRADEELEKTLREGETLSKHKKALLKFAKEKKLNVVEIKEELVSGDSIFFRPKVLELLKEVESKVYNGVLVMDVQRLGRGDTEDQGLIERIFKESHTKIITPQKTYNLDDEYDEDYYEFEAFMGRKEYKMIKKRMQNGRVRSVQDGNYIATNPPFGYDITYINKNRTLNPNEVEAKVVKLIFKMYCDGSGSGVIANHLNSLGYKTKNGRLFERSSIIFILKNPVYIGKITWRKKDIKKSKQPDKKKDTRTRDISEWVVSDGKHEALISEETFNKVQEILKGKYHIPYKLVNGAANPLAGIVICGICGSKMVLRKYGNRSPHLICNKCENKSSRFDYVEKAILNALEDYADNYTANTEKISDKVDTSLYKNQIDSLVNELATLNSQNLKIYDLLEQGVYDNETFIERSKNIFERSSNIENEIKRLKDIVDEENKKISNQIDVNIKDIISAYKLSKNVVKKNALLKSIVINIEYKKAKEQKGDDFEIKLNPRV